MYLSERHDKQVAIVTALAAQGYGLLFFYHGQDRLAKVLAPSLQTFADTYGIELLGISQDGNFLSAITENRRNDKGITVPDTPALLLVNTLTRTLQPVAYGFIDQTALLERLVDVINDDPLDRS